MQYMYCAVLTPIEDGSGYYASVPDLPGCVTSGKDLHDAIEQITDAMSGWLCVAEDEKIEINAPSDPRKVEHGEEDILTMIQTDTLKYRAMTDTRAVRKNVSIPAWMATLVEKYGINCSQVLQEALRERLQMSM